MKNNIFCPVCKTPLSRSPEENNITTNSRTAHFKHRGAYNKIPCALRTKAPKGFHYLNEEDAKKAIENEKLVIVSDWMSKPPTAEDDINSEGEFNQTAIEDKDGPETEVSIARHKGQNFTLPSKISSVTALCRNFDKNLYKGYHFPGSMYPTLLQDMLFNVNKIDRTIDESPRLFFGKITSFTQLDYRNVIAVKCENFRQFKVYTQPYNDIRKHISKSSVGRYVLFHAALTWEQTDTIPRCRVEKWGQYSLLPQKYEKFLPK